MSDNSNVVLFDDLELLTRYLNEQLDPARVAQVRQRLDDDPAFRDFAAPVLLAFQATPRWHREPLPAGEIERNWDEFTKRAGFSHQQRKARRLRLWLFGILFAVLAVPSLLYRSELRAAWRDYRDFEPVRNDTGWVTLRDSNQVRLAPGARLASSKRIEKGVHRVRLVGSARFRVASTDTTMSPLPVYQPLLVETRGGVAVTGYGEFTVTTRGDTTDVEVHRPAKRRFLGFLAMPGQVMVETNSEANPTMLGETQAARLVRGGRTERTKR